jgi:hypothetical protein
VHDLSNPGAAGPDVADGLFTHVVVTRNGGGGHALTSRGGIVGEFDFEYFNDLLFGEYRSGLAGLDRRYFFYL